MKKKKISASRLITSHLMLPQDANPAGNVHGGVIMKLIDDAGGVVAVRHTRTVCVTASIDRIDFHNPVHIGNLVTFKAKINHVGKTSMEIGARVESENLLTGETRHIASAYLTFVALDVNLKPVAVPGLIFETEKEKQRNQAAQARRKARLGLLCEK